MMAYTLTSYLKYPNMYVNNHLYCTRENFSGRKLANRELFTKIFLASIHRHTEMYLAYALTVAYSPNFSSPIAFTCMVHKNFPLPNISLVYSNCCSICDAL